MPATIQTIQHSTALSQSQTDKNKINNETQDSEPGQQNKTTKEIEEKGEEKEEEEEEEEEEEVKQQQEEKKSHGNKGP